MPPKGPHNAKQRKRMLMIYGGVAAALLLVVIMSRRRAAAAATAAPTTSVEGAPAVPVANPTAPGDGSATFGPGVDNSSQLAQFESALLDAFGNQTPTGGSSFASDLAALGSYEAANRGKSGAQSGPSKGHPPKPHVHPKAHKHVQPHPHPKPHHHKLPNTPKGRAHNR